MKALTLKAHFDGRQILLDEPYELRPGTPLAVTVLPSSADADDAAWTAAAAASLARAYGDDEPEYTTADLKP